MPAQKSAKTVFFEANAKGSPQKWGDDDDEDMSGSSQKNDESSSDPKDGNEGSKGHNAITEERRKRFILLWLRKRAIMARPLERMNKILPLRSSVPKAPPNGSKPSCKKGNTHSRTRLSTLLAV